MTGTDVKKYYSFEGQSILRDEDGLQYFLSDHLGSVVAITDDQGTLTSQQRYLPFGGVRQLGGSFITQTDYGYTGQRDLGMGLMDYKARFYSPMLGRFIQPDTLIPEPDTSQAWNRFSYVNNRPILFNDPTGHCSILSLIPATSTACLVQVASAAGQLAGRAIKNGGLEDEDFKEVADIVAPAVASGSKSSVSGFVSMFATKVRSFSLVSTADGKVQFFDEKVTGRNFRNLFIPKAAALPGAGVSATHGFVFGLYDSEKKAYAPSRYAGGATQGNLSIPLGPCGGTCGLYGEGYLSDDRKVGGIDFGVEFGAGPTLLGAAHVNATPKGSEIKLNGKGLLICRLMSMCGAAVN